MAHSQRGLAIVWGAQGVTFTAGIVSGTNGAKTQSLRVVRSSDKAEVMNDQGEVVGQVYFNGKKTLSISVIPSHASAISSAQSSLDAHLIAPGTKVTVADDQGTTVDGDYNLISATANRTNNGVAVVDVELEKYDANDVTTSVS